MGGYFKIVLQSERLDIDAEKVFAHKNNDHKILNSAFSLQQEEKEAKVILVSKDINLRLKAKALNLPAEDYKTCIAS